SGSTGQPKGTVLSHRSLANHSTWMRALCDLRPGERGLQLTSLSFDVSVTEVFSTLLSGATLVMAPPEAHRDPAVLRETLVRHDITVLQVVPSMLRVLLDDPALRTATRLRWLISGGEALPADLPPRVRQALPHVRLNNNYGPTETTIDATSWRVEGTFSSPVAPIGRPMANAQAYVLDAHMRPVPTGVPGELYMGGVGLARGYLHRPHLTAERFVPNPFSTEPGARLYRTGDKVRWLADGTLDFLGRIDFQVKLRGLRIEPGEIEAALKQQPGVLDATVLVREDLPGNPRLVAYVVPREGGAVDTTELRQGLTRGLPEYMVPSAFVTLAALPLTPSGKLDRKALPAPDSDTDTAATWVAPRTPAEQALAGLMAQLLRVERVGAEDSFFALGGHSLLATQLASRIRASFGVELPLRILFEEPTVAGLAARLDVLRQETASAPPPLVPVPRAGVMPASFAQRRLWFIEQLQPGSPLYNMPIALRLKGALDVRALERAFDTLVHRHEGLRTTFSTRDGEPVQVIHAAADLALPVMDLSDLPTEEREARARSLVTEEALRPFDLAAGPLMRASLVRLDTREHLLLLTLHHIVTDGWSMDVMVRESAALYAAFSAGQPSPLPELAIQYADYAAWQRGWLQGEALEAQLSWWRNHLTGAPQLLELPTDFPRPAVQGFRGAIHTHVLPRELVDALQALSRREGTTLFMALLAGLEVVLSRYSGQEDFVVGTDIANRNRGETEGLIGFFINQLALRARLDGDPTFRELLGRVRDVTLGAYAHQDLPFEELVKELNPERSMGHAPLFQVKLVL
ncbi:amino acid adenylation domain-containing protein, partial [Pyxidicoccus sp. 3LG]